MSKQPSIFDALRGVASTPLPAHTITLGRIDGGYFDALAAIGCAALIDAYYDCKRSPLIVWKSHCFEIIYAGTERETPNLSWLKYSVAGTWRKDNDPAKWKAPKGFTLKAKGWDGIVEIPTHEVEIDVSLDKKTFIDIGGKRHEITDPHRQLYGVVNKLGAPDWFNLCVYAGHKRGLDLLHDRFDEPTIGMNSIVLPQASKGAFSKGAFSIGNSSLPASVTRPLSRMTCLAVAGFVVAVQGQAPQKGEQGFILPVPKHIRLNAIRHIAKGNRERFVSKGVFFGYDNYLSFLRLLLIYIDDHDANEEEISLHSVAGARFISLGTSSSPAGAWSLAVPKYRYSLASVERLQRLLIDWKRKATAGARGTVSIDRVALARLVQGFAEGVPMAAAEGYLNYIFSTGLISKQGSFYPLNQSFFEEIMNATYSELVDKLLGEDIKPFIDIIRRETFNEVYKKTPSPNYQMMRKLREVQSVEDFVVAVSEIAIERAVTTIATSKSETAKAKFWARERALVELIALAEAKAYSPRLIAQLILALALCKRPYEAAEGEEEVDAAPGPDENDS